MAEEKAEHQARWRGETEAKARGTSQHQGLSHLPAGPLPLGDTRLLGASEE